MLDEKETIPVFLDRLLQIENDQGLFDFKFNDFHFWPLVREKVIHHAINENFEFIDPWGGSVPTLRSYLKYFFLNLKYSAWKMPEAEIIIFGSDISNIKTGNGYFNRITEYFANEFKENTVLLEVSSFNMFKRPRTFNRVYSWDSITCYSLAFNKLFHRKICPNSDVENFILYLKQNLNYTFQSDFYDELTNILCRYEHKIPIIDRAYTSFFVKKKPKIIFIEQGCYGADTAIIIKCAKRLGIRVAEMQHGYIGEDHPAYMYSPQICSEYIQYLPDDFLCYGNYWKQNSRIPIQVLNIGNPYLSEIVQSVKGEKSKTLVLYISSAINARMIIEEVLKIDRELKKYNYQLIFRPHPCEIQKLDKEYAAIVDACIPIDKANLYDSLAGVKFVVSNIRAISTVMFEALAFQCVSIFIKNRENSESIPSQDCFLYVDSIVELVDIIKDGKHSEVRYDDVWEMEWKMRYGNYIKHYL